MISMKLRIKTIAALFVLIFTLCSCQQMFSSGGGEISLGGAEDRRTLDSDKIVVVKNGAICESGSHDELLALGGEYYTLYQNQFAGIST